MVESPLVSRDEAAKAFAAIRTQLNLDPITTNFIGVLAARRRKNQLDAVVPRVPAARCRDRGEVIAEVVTARPLNDDQLSQLRPAPRPCRPRRQRRGDRRSTVLGGIVVNWKATRIDASIRTELNQLAQAMERL